MEVKKYIRMNYAIDFQLTNGINDFINRHLVRKMLIDPLYFYAVSDSV